MTPDGTKPTPYKRYYDVFTWLVTQLAFSFTTTGFVLLSVHDTLKVWAAVYFYCIIGVAACTLFLVTPGKIWLQKKTKARSSARPAVGRSESMENLQGATLGVPSEPGKECKSTTGKTMHCDLRHHSSGTWKISYNSSGVSGHMLLKPCHTHVKCW